MEDTKKATNLERLTAVNEIQGKDSHFQAQTRRAYKAFYSKPKTMLMVSIETGILRANLCRYVAKWKKQNTIEIIGFGICPISKSTGVQFLTTNPDLFPAIVK